MDGGNPRVSTIINNHSLRHSVDGGNPRVSTRGEYLYHSPNIPAPNISMLQNTTRDASRLWVYYQNVRGLRTKIDDFYCNVLECNFDVIILIETGLNEAINSTQLFGSNYNVYRCDRSHINSSKSRFGGVLIAVHHRFISSSVVATSGETIEQVCVSTRIGSKRLLLCAIYVPPDKSKDLSVLNGHIESIQELCNSGSDSDCLLVCGDYNQPGISWSWADGEIRPVNSVPLPVASSFLIDGMDFHNLHQRNLERNHLGRILDLFFCHTDFPVEISRSVSPLLPVDLHHPPLVVCLPSLVDDGALLLNASDELALDYSKIDFDVLMDFLSVTDWDLLFDGLNADEMAETLCAVLNNWMDTNVPIRRPAVSPAWSTALLRKLKRKRNASQRRLRRYRSLANKRSFHLACNEYRNLNSSLYKSYVLRVQTNLRRNPKSFWSYVNSKRKNSTMPASVFFNDVESSIGGEKCELFAAHFSSVFAAESITSTELVSAVSDVPSNLVDINTFEITPVMVTNAAKKMKCTFSPGPDGIPSAVYCRTIGALVEPLCRIFNKSFVESKFPAIWKESFMVPVHKKGDKRDVKNYRGITNLSAASKLFEIIVSGFILEHTKCYISSDQHGFMPGRSVTTNLLDFTTTCFEQLENGAQIDVIYTDLKAAFDTINHDIMLAKLSKLGASDRLTSWLCSYLTDRSLRVKLDSSTSSYFTNSSGVPQGSNLGPLLFVLYINDALLLLGDGCKLAYADDLKLYFVVRTAEDCIRLQSVLDLFVDWCRRNKLTLSIPKCMVMSYYRIRQPIVFDYAINGVVLQRTDQFSDLGVLLDHKLTFNLHRSALITKANRQLGFVSKISKDFIDPHCLKALYCSLVRPILENASLVWFPHQLTWSLRIESVQRKFIRIALRNLPWRDPQNLPPYSDRCNLLSLDTLECRRKNQQAVFVAKLLNGEVDCSRLLSLLDIRVPPRTLRSGTLLQPRYHRTAFGYNEPLTTMMRTFTAVEELFEFGESSSRFLAWIRNT